MYLSLLFPCWSCAYLLYEYEVGDRVWYDVITSKGALLELYSRYAVESVRGGVGGVLEYLNGCTWKRVRYFLKDPEQFLWDCCIAQSLDPHIAVFQSEMWWFSQHAPPWCNARMLLPAYSAMKRCKHVRPLRMLSHCSNMLLRGDVMAPPHAPLRSDVISDAPSLWPSMMQCRDVLPSYVAFPTFFISLGTSDHSWGPSLTAVQLSLLITCAGSSKYMCIIIQTVWSYTSCFIPVFFKSFERKSKKCIIMPSF